MPNPKPLIAAAFVCEKVLKEGDVFSAIRIVDTYTTKVMKVTAVPYGDKAPLVDGPSAAGAKILNQNQVLDMTALVMVRAGQLRGQHEMTVEVSGPDGKSVKYPQPFKINFALDDPAEAATLNIRFVLAGDSPEGRYWINVFWNGEPLTQIPVKLVRQSESPAAESGGQLK